MMGIAYVAPLARDHCAYRSIHLPYLLSSLSIRHCHILWIKGYLRRGQNNARREQFVGFCFVWFFFP